MSSSGDDVGCFLLILAALWYFGFVSFQWRDKGEADVAQLEEVREELAEAEVRLAQLSRVVQEIKTDSSVLAAQRSSLEQQVARLERARDEIASSLTAASNIVAAPAKSGWRSFLDEIFTGVIGNLISAAILAGLSWMAGKRVWRFWKRRRGQTSPPASPVT